MVAKRIGNNGLIHDTIRRIIENPEVIQELVDNVADEMADLLEEDQEIKRKIMAVIPEDTSFQKSVLCEVVSKIGSSLK